MHKLLVLSCDATEYHSLIAAARLPALEIYSSSTAGQVCIDCDLAFGEPALLREVLPRLPALRWVQSTWAGVEPLMDPTLRRDYVLTGVRDVFARLMTEYVFAYMLAHERQILPRYASQRAGRWDARPPGSLSGRVLGLLGVGSIGMAIARRAQQFGMRVKGYTLTSEGCPDVDAYFHPGALTEFAADLDYVVCVMPHTPATRVLVDASFLAALPARAVLLNPGRGALIDDAALADALEAGRLAGAVLDVFNEEPLPANHVFWRTPNLLITSHTAAPSFAADIAPVFIHNYQRLVRGEPLEHRVDFERGY